MPDSPLFCRAATPMSSLLSACGHELGLKKQIEGDEEERERGRERKSYLDQFSCKKD